LPARRPVVARPAAPGAPGSAGVAASEAVRLFELRARLVQPAFTVEPGNANAVALVCRRLEGIPLAIELAAPRMGAVSVHAVLANLEDRLRQPQGEVRPAAARHRTLHAALDWGHDLLDDQERRLFRRASVFVGGFELAAAEAVCAGDGVVAAEVETLVF